jgi:hypothetical protein
MRRKHVLAALGVVLAVGAAAFAATAASKTAQPPGDDPNDASLTYWYWAEPDAPGANNWLKKQVAAYEKLHPKVKIKIVVQSTDTLTSAFTTAAQTKSGPDIATQWATLPVLTLAWNGASVPISDYVPAKEIKNWIGTAENMSGGKLWAMPQYLLGIPSVWNKAPPGRQASIRTRGQKDVGGVPGRRQEALAAGITPFGMEQGRVRWRLVLLPHRQAEPELHRRAQGGDDRQGELRETEFSGLLQGARDLRSGATSTRTSRRSLRAGPAALRTEEGCDVLDHGWQTSRLRRRCSAARREWASAPSRSGARESLRGATTPRSRRALHHEVVEAPAAAAQFLTFLHSPKALRAWYAATGVFPADKRFPARLVTDPIAATARARSVPCLVLA